MIQTARSFHLPECSDTGPSKRGDNSSSVLFRCRLLLQFAAPEREIEDPMERDYDLFERSQDSSLIWRGSVHGLENARRKLQELARRKTNECLAMHTPTRQICAPLNIAEAGQLRGKRVVFQIAYDEHRLLTRAELLRRNGYQVVSVIGNEAAKD